MTKNNADKAVQAHHAGKSYWFSSLGARLTAYHFFFLVVLIISTIAALYYIEKNVLLVQGHEQSRQLGNRIVAELGQRVAATETLTKNLAQLGLILEKDPEIFKKNVPGLIDMNGDSRIAGGGIWPEPFAFDSKIRRRSFFWGREKDGSLKYYDDYNKEDGPGYHNEEWYVPARYLKKNSVYWSKSYMDPYSFEPMVTCTAPMTINGKFAGVATIDLKLTGMDEFFKEKAKGTEGYIFAVDRNNKLLSYPDKVSAKHFHKDSEGQISEEFMTISELTNKFKDYEAVEKLLSNINRNVYESNSSNKLEIEELSKKLAEESYQIDQKDAENIAAFLYGMISSDEQKIQLSYDPLLQKQVLVYTFAMPSTGWKVLVVTPLAKVNEFAREVTFKILKVIIFLELIVLLFMFLIMNRSITAPLAGISEKLQNVSDLETQDIILDEEKRSDEIGHLAHEVNKRTTVIKNIIDKLKKSNAALEDRVKERTYEIEQALKQVEEAKLKAEAANQSKSHFLANMSHEIRTPMNAILGYTDLLYKEIQDPRLKNYIFTIKNSGQSLLTLINDILDLSKVEAGKIELQLSPVKIHNTFQSIVEQFNDIAEKKGVHIELEIDETIPKALMMDNHRLRQILINLVGNAIKFMDEGKVSIHVSNYESNVLTFSVTDEGPGIPEDKQEQIFEDFEQVDNVDIGSGTGLGLAITKRLVELMDGTISVKSKVGEGSAFTVTLNGIKETHFEEAEEEFELEEDVELIFHEATILIADDVKNNINLLLEYLEPYPFTTILAEDGKQAFDLCLKHKPDLILMDMKMPVMDGFTASQKIKETPEISHIPIIAVTAAAMKTTENEIRELCDGYLRKPVNETQLLNGIADFLKVEVVKKGKDKPEVTSEQNARGLLGKMDTSFIAKVLEVSENREINELHALIKELKKANSDYPSYVFENWIKEIEEAMDNFDMDGVQKELERVKDVMQDLKETTNF